MKIILGVGVLLLSISSFAQQDVFANYGGLYFCPDTKDLFYVEWDGAPDQHNAIAVYWSATGQKPRRMQIATQYIMTSRNIKNDVYFIQLWEEARPNAQYECMFRFTPEGGRPTMTMNLKDATRKYEFLMIGNEEHGYMDEGDKQHESMVMTLSNLKFYYYDKDKDAYHYEIPITVGLAEDPSILQIQHGNEENGTYYLATFNNSFDLLAGTEKVDRSKTANRIRFGTINKYLLVMHLFDPAGKYLYSFAESHSDFVGEDTF